MIKVSDYIFNYLAKSGIEQVFVISGGGAMHLVDSLGNNKKIRYLCTHHEQAAAIAAEGYARAGEKMAAVLVTSGPGGTNTLTGVIGQWLDSVPALYLSGQVKFETTIASVNKLKLRQLGDQEINIVDIVKPVTKYAVMIKDAHKVRYHLGKALYLARNGRPGPVWLDIPLNVQAVQINPKKLSGYNPNEDAIKFNLPSIDNQIKIIIEKIKQAKRPVLMVGQGIRIAGAAERLIKLVEKLNIPVLTAICGHDLIPSSLPLFFGRPGICGDRTGNFIVQNCDLLLMIGARMGLRQVSYDFKHFAREAFKIMVDIDPAEMNKPTIKPDLKVHTDGAYFIDRMLVKLGKQKMEGKKDWLAWCKKQKAILPTILEDNKSNKRYVNSYRFADILFKQLRSGDLVVTGNGSAYTSTFQVMQIKKGMRVFANQGCASMGYDLPAAIGACMARKKRPVILITGDGSIQMNLQELETIAFNQLPIKIFVLNNRGYLSIRTTQDSYFKGRYYASSPEGGVACPDMLKIAAAFGLKALRIKNEKGLEKQIRKVRQMSGPVLCEIMMDPAQTLYPKLSSVVKSDGRLVSRPLEDMFPFLPRPEFGKHMLIKPLEEE